MADDDWDENMGLDDVSSLGNDAGSLATKKAEDTENDQLLVGLDDEEEVQPQAPPAAAVDDDDDDEVDKFRKTHKDEIFNVAGKKMHPAFNGSISPMEFEEIVALFDYIDVNKNGFIDKFEARKLLFDMKMDASLVAAEKLLSLISLAGAPDINFDEWTRFIVNLKNKDSRILDYAAVLDIINQSVLGRLEAQSKIRNLDISFYRVERLDQVFKQGMPLFVYELQIVGEWYHVEDGKRKSRFEIRKFVGTGDTIRDAKIAAGNAALSFYEHVMPGLKYPPGEVPHEWMQWIDDNLNRGVDPVDIISILAGKGFNPQKNVALMQRVLTWTSFSEFMLNHPDFDASESYLDFQFQEWVKGLAMKGVDGGVILDVLEDRGVHLSVEHIHFAQQLKTNQLGCLIDRDGKDAYMLDFWRACQMGYVDEVRIYCACLMPVSEEQVGRHTGDAQRPLTLAAMGNHVKVMKLLISHGADVRAIDRRGRSALHFAAYYGNREACEVLVEAKAFIFGGDHQGNNALHMAALGNRPNCVDFLSFKAQELCAAISSDKVICKTGYTFMKLVEETFHEIQRRKLSMFEARRVEKKWLEEVAQLFIELMNPEVRYMLAPPCDEVAKDVLLRFDPRPESGMYVATGALLIPTFTPTIGTVAELATLLQYLFRQTACDSVNALKRTALHLLCDANQLNSHAESIRILTEIYGCNTNMKDKLGYTALQLLMADKKYANNPSATRIREEYITTVRENELDKLGDQFDKEDYDQHTHHRLEIMESCVNRAENPSAALWPTIRECSKLFRKYEVGMWESYEDPDTLNFFYCRAPYMDDDERIPHSDYSWTIPPQIKASIDRNIALDFHRSYRSTLRRTFGNWQTLYCNLTNTTYFYDPKTDELRYSLPEAASWDRMLRISQTVGKFGYGNEWLVMQDPDGNQFYRHQYNGECYWDQPSDAVQIKPSEMLCSAFQFRGKAVAQKWYTCEQCNRGWRLAGKTSKVQIKLCEGCIARCHKGHKGIRFVKDSIALCICEDVCRAVGSQCRGGNLSERQQTIQRMAFDERIELKRKKEHDKIMPPVFTMMPTYYPDGRRKKYGGWILCRRAPLNGKPLNRFGEVVANEDDDEDTDDEDDYHPEEPIQNSTVEAVPESSTDSLPDVPHSATNSIEPPFPLADDLSVRSLESKTDLTEEMKPRTRRCRSTEPEEVLEFRPPEGLPDGWIVCVDVEEPHDVPIGARVLCNASSSPPLVYGNVTGKQLRGRWGVYYSVKVDNVPVLEHLSRDCLQVLDKPIFYSNPSTGQCAWTIEDAVTNPIESTSMSMTGNEWLEMHLTSNFRRQFGKIDEHHTPICNFVYYVDPMEVLRERCILLIQSTFRKKWKRPLATLPWQSYAFSMDMNPQVLKLSRELSGWAYLRRRSECLGDFNDIDKQHWEEYMDKITLELFYWQEENNLYCWDKPEYPDAASAKAVEFFKINEDATFVTPDGVEELVTVIKLRFDDETGEDMYDVCKKFEPSVVFKWVSRIQLKAIPLEGEEYILMRAELRWRKQLKRQREADERKRKKDLEAKIARAMSRFNLGLPPEEDSSDIAVKQRAKLLRVDQEKRDVEDEQEYKSGAERRAKVVAQLEALRTDANQKMSRADFIRVSRQLDLKLRMDEKIELSKRIKFELARRKKIYKDRVEYTEDYLREKEEPVTTPRSFVRRNVIRHLNMAMNRQKRRFMICQWGCGDWIQVGQKQIDHQTNLCPRRIIGCTLGCAMKLAEEDWHRPAKSLSEDEINKLAMDMEAADLQSMASGSTRLSKEERMKKDAELGIVHHGLDMSPLVEGMTYQQYHEEEECVKRLVDCPRHCLEFVQYDKLEHHLKTLCTKRPAEPLICRLGCGEKFGGLVESLIEAEDDRLLHEMEQCEFRIVRCNWKFDDDTICASQMPYREREAHRDYHLTMMGCRTFLVAGTYTYRVPKMVQRLKIQVWGAGGGSGYFWDRRGANGGGGAFVEVIINVEPYEILEIVVGAGGGAGVQGTEVQVVDVDVFRKKAAAQELIGKKVTQAEKDAVKDLSVDVIDSSCGVALGGAPGGGDGYGGGGSWACGGGGGYSMISLRSAFGNTAFIVAAGGGGGGSIDGLPGVGMEGPHPGTKIDPINGETATGENGGREGHTGSVYNSKWPATAGTAWQGGSGSEFGAGGGGGYFGGGGGGTLPGIGGAGGGGSSYVYIPRMHDYVIIHGHGNMPGGLDHDPPKAVGLGEWDLTGGLTGQGGVADKCKTSKGNSGGVRIIKPGHY